MNPELPPRGPVQLLGARVTSPAIDTGAPRTATQDPSHFGVLVLDMSELGISSGAAGGRVLIGFLLFFTENLPLSELAFQSQVARKRNRLISVVTS